jgi:hypothetical protein
VVDVVENPLDANRGFIRVLRATKDDPLAGLLARGQIDLAQHGAGRRWQQYWEDVEGHAMRAIDPTREPVDGRAAAVSPFADRRLTAVYELRACTEALGWEGDRIVRLVLAERMQINAVATQLERPARYMGTRFRECLETMAKRWHLA